MVADMEYGIQLISLNHKLTLLLLVNTFYLFTLFSKYYLFINMEFDIV
jgi:hypothetical protein